MRFWFRFLATIMFHFIVGLLVQHVARIPKLSEFSRSMKSLSFLLSVCALGVVSLSMQASASVFMPYTMQVKTDPRSMSALARHQQSSKNDLRWALRQRRSRDAGTAMAIPGYGVAEQVFVGGFANFLSIYNLVITARILLSWFPQAQGVALLQPVFAITDPYLNLFRGLIPPLFGLDFSPILAFVLLNLLSSATAAVGAEIPPELKQKYHNKSVFGQQSSIVNKLTHRLGNTDQNLPSMNL